jgi:DNA-binding transcriptional regulator GbsR (MarR family)
MYAKEDTVSVKNFEALNIRKGESPFENAIININSNLEDHEGPTSSTRMIYEIVKKMDLISRLPEKDQETLERFVYFVDFAYRLKQRIYGMDTKYIYGTLFGNYKRLTLQDIWDYLKTNPTKT